MTRKGVDASAATRVYLRHAEQQLWYGDKEWWKRRAQARTFSSPLEAILVCRKEQLRVFLVGFNGQDQKVFQLRVDELLDADDNRPLLRDS